MKALEHLQNGDWDSAIAAATKEIDASNKSGGNKSLDDYLYRGIARCFVANKDGKHTEAIADLSMALSNGGTETEKEKAYYYRAFAYYLDGNYERAIADCYKTTAVEDKKLREGKEFKELLGKIYFDLGKYEKAVEVLSAALKDSIGSQGNIVSPGLLRDYIDACKRMNKG